MTTALAINPASLPVAAVTVTPEQLELVKRTVASGATDAELKLFLFDCQRQGVHPLDNLLHFTKRGGKYTPITSIDFMRTRAADTGEYAGSDDAAFFSIVMPQPHPDQATVTVYRLVQGLRCAFTATARWAEYCPATGQDHMWRKMPHAMLAKCAEALALRKGFPRQLAGLYAKEEMDQAGPVTNGYAVEAPAVAPVSDVPAGHTGTAADRKPHLVPNEGEIGASLPAGAITIRRIDTSDTRNKNVTKCLLSFSTGEQASTINKQLASLAEQICQEGTPVKFTTKATKWGDELVTLERALPEAWKPFAQPEPEHTF